MPLIQCPTCDASYEIAETDLGGAGRKVRCAACRTLWIAAPAHGEAGERACEHQRAAALAEAALAPAELLSAGRRETPEARLPWHLRIKGPQPAGRSARWPAYALAALVLLIVGGIGLRKQVVRAAPETAKLFETIGLPVNLRGLELSGVRSGLMSEGSMDILVVQGVISNITGQKQSLPPLKFSVRDAKGVEIYAWTANADAKSLDAGQSLAFRRRLASPPAEGAKVLVRFADRVETAGLGH